MRFIERGKSSKVKELISTALIIVALNSIIWTIILILGAEDIAQVFNDERLVHALKVISLAISFSTLSVNRTIFKSKHSIEKSEEEQS